MPIYEDDSIFSGILNQLYISCKLLLNHSYVFKTLLKILIFK